MKINSDDYILGISIVRIRELFRHHNQNHIAAFGTQNIARYLHLETEMAERLAHELEQQGYIDKKPRYSEEDQIWQITMKGNALSLASAAKPITRKTADKAVADFIQRVKKVNADPGYLWKVTIVVLFGSYINTSNPRINDVDIAIILKPKPDTIANPRLNEQHILLAERSGRYFQSNDQRANWPYTEVLLYLKSRSRTISLHDYKAEASSGMLTKANSKILYAEDQGWNVERRKSGDQVL